MMLTKQDYLEKRVKAQQSFFSQKAANNKKKYYIAQVDIKSGKKKIIAEGVSDDKIIYTKGILRYVDADGNTKISGCR